MKDILTRRELVDLLELIHFLTLLDNKKQFLNAARTLGTLLEYEHLVFGLPHCSRDRARSVKELNVSYPEEWISLYRENSYWLIDPLILVSSRTASPLYWQEVYRSSGVDPEFLGLSREFGLVEGWTCRSRGEKELPWLILSVAGRAKRCKSALSRDTLILDRLTPHFHAALARLTRAGSTAPLPSPLSTREREVLKWLSEGKTSQEIGVILKIAVTTVNFHVSNIKAKLNTVNRSQAVATALQQGLLSP